MLKIILASLVVLFGVVEGVEQKVEVDAKKEEIFELIRLSVLDQMDLVLAQMVQATIVQAKSDLDSQKVVIGVRQKLLSKEFLEKYVPSFDKTFTQAEIKTLLDFYRSDALKKMSKAAVELVSPIYGGMRELIAEVVKPAPTADRVVTVTASNFQKEVRDFKGTVLLEAYSLMCGPCQVVAPIFSDLSLELGDKIKFCKFDVSAEPALSKELEVLSVPTILFIRDGKIIDRHIGLLSKDDLKKKATDFGVEGERR